jgi:HEAT repeat protein
MPEPAEQPAKPIRTWRPMATWTAGILLALGLIWFATMMTVPVWQVHAALETCPMRDVIWGLHIEDEDQARALKQLGGSDPALSKLRVYLAMPERLASQRAKAARLSGFCGKPAVPLLARLLADRDWQVRVAAANGLKFMGCEAEPAIPALVEALGDKTGNVLGAAEDTLTELGPLAVPALTAAADRSAFEVRYYAIWTLGRIGPDATGAVPSLLRALADEDEFAYVAACALFEMGPVAGEEAACALEARLKQATDPLLRASLAGALWQVSGRTETVLPAFVELLSSEDEIPRGQAAWFLGDMGPAAAEAIPSLERLLKDGSRDVREVAAEALKKIRGESAKT